MTPASPSSPLEPIAIFLEPTGRVRKSIKSLPAEMKEELRRAVDELIDGNVPRGRRFEKLVGLDGLYSVRLNRHYRFVFRIFKNIAMPIAAGPHDEAYRDASRHI